MYILSVVIAVVTHLFPFLTEKLRPPAPKILGRMPGKIGRRRDNIHKFRVFCSIGSLITSLSSFYSLRSVV